MPETPHSLILNREEATNVASQYFVRQTELLRDLANYGSNLILRAFDSSPKRFAEVVVCGVLLKQIVAMVDASEVLLAAGCGHAAFLPARSAFEASLYIDWIFLAESERRAVRFIVSNYRDDRLWSSRVVPGSDEEVEFRGVATVLGADPHLKRSSLVEDAVAHIREIDAALAQPELASVNAEFIAARKKRKYDPAWYELDGVQSIKQISEKVGRQSEYLFFYSKGSKVAHTGSYRDHIFFSNGGVEFKPIRHLADVNMLLNFLVSIVVATYQKVLTRYRPDEIQAFAEKYLQDWRDPFVNVTVLNYNFRG